MEQRELTCLGSDLLAGSASLETVLGAAADVLEVAHAAGTGGLSALSLLAPLVRADLSGGVAARGADLLLQVERASVASSAHGVRLGAVRRKECRRGWKMVSVLLLLTEGETRSPILQKMRMPLHSLHLPRYAILLHCGVSCAQIPSPFRGRLTDACRVRRLRS